MSFDVLTLTPANGAGRRDEIVFAYPSGRSASDYETTGAYLDINAGELKYRQADEVFSVSYKADGVHVYWNAGPVVPAGKLWTLRAPLTRDAEISAGSPITINGITDALENWLGNMSATTITNRSGAITAGGTAQQLAAANTARRGFSVQNLSSGDLWISTVGTAAASAPSLWLPAGAYYEMPTGGVSSGAVSIFGATTGQAFTAYEW